MLKLMMTTVVLPLSLLGATEAYAKSLQCNRDQSYCLVRNRSLTVGDPVGFFSKDEELVAVGKVRRTMGAKRRIEVTKHLGQINQGYRVARLETTSIDSLSQSYEIYHPKHRVNAGGELSLVRVGIGDGVTGYAATAFADYGWMKGIHFSGKLEYLSASGEVNGGFFAPKLNAKAELSAITLAPGIAYHLNKNKLWSARLGMNVGMAYVIASADGSEDLFPIYVKKMDQGAGVYSSATGGVYKRLSEWKLGAGAQYFRLHEANSYSLSLLASMPIN